jgi:serine/threonine-protein kinase
MGVVYEALDPKRERTVALKVIAPEIAKDLDFMARFRREGRAQAAVLHENVVAMLDAGSDGTLAYLAFELVRGGTLHEKVRRTGSKAR